MNLNTSQFILLIVLGIIGAAAIIPYSAALQGGMALTPRLIVLSILQGAVLSAVAVWVGLAASRSLGLNVATPWAQLPVPIILGIAAAVLIIVLEVNLFLPRLPEALTGSAAAGAPGNIALWKRLLAGLYGGINEELLMRLFLLSGLLWLLTRIWHGDSGAPVVAAFWTVNIVVAIIFGLGHLPALRGITEITPLLVGRAIVLNSVAGVVFGWIFWQYGLAAAMAAHFSADMVLHVIAPYFFSGL